MAVDSYMNLQVISFTSFLSLSLIFIYYVMHLQLADAEEYIEGELAGNLGEILIRCNNVLYMREAEAS